MTTRSLLPLLVMGCLATSGSARAQDARFGEPPFNAEFRSGATPMKLEQQVWGEWHSVCGTPCVGVFRPGFYRLSGPSGTASTSTFFLSHTSDDPVRVHVRPQSTDLSDAGTVLIVLGSATLVTSVGLFLSGASFVPYGDVNHSQLVGAGVALGAGVLTLVGGILLKLLQPRSTVTITP